MSSRSRQGGAHPRIGRALEILAASNLQGDCSMPPPEALGRGIAEFNSGRFFEQHETLEELWRAESRPIRYLYQGILQVGVGFLHLERGNYHGAVNKLQNGLALLGPFEPSCLELDIARLRRETIAWLERLRALGPRGMGAISSTGIPRIHPARSR